MRYWRYAEESDRNSRTPLLRVSIRGGATEMMTGLRRDFARKAWIVLPAVVLTVADAGLTLLFQPSTYWAGERTTAHEISPLGAAFLHVHPAAFAAFMVAWVCLIVLIAGRLREPWNLVWVLMVVIGHSAGAFDWIEDLSYVGALPTFFVAALLTVFCWRKAATARRP